MPPREVNKAGLDLVRKFEGLYLKSYRCPAGVWTIGYGHTGDVMPGMHITRAQADLFLQQDMAKAGLAVTRLVGVELHDNQFAALCSFVFNAGEGSLKASTLLKRLNTGDYDCVPIELAKWVKATNPATGQKVTLPGLVKRRAAEGELWLDDDRDDAFLADKHMPQRVSADESPRSFSVVARRGLKLRGGPGVQFDELDLLPLDTQLYVLTEKDEWAAVDLEGDGRRDGWVCKEFLKPCL